MRTVFPNSMVAHVWAQQSQVEGRSANGQFFFSGDTIYSYGHHFPIARFIKRKGRQIVLFTIRDYSVTTSSHKSMARRAIPADVEVIYCFDIHDGDYKNNIRIMKEEIATLVRKAATSRTRKNELLRQARSKADNAARYAALYGRKVSVPVVEMTREDIKQEEKRKAEKETREARKRERKAQERLIQWKAGEVDGSFNSLSTVYLRIKGDELQTSLGATVPLEHAIRALPFIRAGRDWHRNGKEIRVGHFHFDKIDAAGNVVAGCHTIKREEIERVAAQIGA